jgi:DNA-binding SARP family transcriptional activator
MAAARQAENGTLRVRLLGPVAVARSGRAVEIRGSRPLAVLSLLALRAGERVSIDELVEGIWDDDVPAQARHALHVYISELRSLLGGSAIETRDAGYALCIESDRVDAVLFRTLARRINGGPAEETLPELRAALALWHGPALEGAAESPLLRSAAAALEEQRLDLLERRFAAELEVGLHAQVVGELAELVAASPLRERLRAQLMLALYRCGRQAEALECYRDGRDVLISRLGLEPHRDLRDLEQAILRQDPSLREWEGGRAANSTCNWRPARLPART